jgi:hypothetical protein
MGIGIMEIRTTGIDSQDADTYREYVARELDNLGMYTVLTRDDLKEKLLTIKVTFPRHCHDPRCMIDVGRTLGLGRMLHGHIDKLDSRYGIRLEMIDVHTQKPIESVSIKSSAEASVEGLIRAAIFKLHGYEDKELDIAVDRYHGPQFDRKKDMYIVTGSAMASALVWGLLSGTLLNEADRQWQAAPSASELSGINTNTRRIPLFGRPAAMANAYRAVADDAYGLFYNPAGVAWTGQREVALAYQMRYGTLQNSAVAYVDKATREIGFGAGLLYSGSELYNELFFTCAWAYKFYELIPQVTPFSVGVSLTCASKSTVKEADYASQITAKTFGVGVDIGVLWQISDRIRYGCVLEDARYVEKINNTQTNYHYLELQPPVLSMGGAYRAGYATLLVANGTIPLLPDQHWKMAGGVEREFFRFINARVGMEKYIQSHVQEPWKVTTGVGIDVPLHWGSGTRIDASYEFNTSTAVFNVFNMSLRWAF